MLQALRSNQPIAVLLILLPIPAVLLLRWLLPSDPEATSSLMYSPLLAVFPPLKGAIWHYVLIAINGYFLNRLLNNHELCRQPMVLVGFLTVLLASSLPLVLPLSPVLAATPLYLEGINQTLKVYRQPQVTHFYFNAGFLFGASTLLSPSYLTAMLALFAAVFYTRTGQWRELFLPLLGFLLPPLFFLTLVWLFGVKTPDGWVYATADLLGSSSGLAAWMFYAFVGVLTLFGITRMLGSFNSSSNKSKNSKALLLVFLLAQCIGLPFWVSESLTFQAQWILPTAVLLLSYVFLDRSGRWQQILFYLLVVLAAFNATGILN